MTRKYPRNTSVVLILISILWVSAIPSVLSADEGGEKATCQIRIDQKHPWRSPFGIERIGRPLTVTVDVRSQDSSLREFWLASYIEEKEISRHPLQPPGKATYTYELSSGEWPTELRLLAASEPGEDPTELARQEIYVPRFEADATACPDTIVNPVDLGTILPPADWLLLGSNQNANLDVAAISRDRDLPKAKLSAWFESAPHKKVVVSLPLAKGRRTEENIALPPAPAQADRDVLHVTIDKGEGSGRWHKTIQTMLVQQPPQWPRFGAVETKLRYDAPISVRAEDGTLSTMDYAHGWEPSLNDVVVSLPNGSRFVFWRGASYIPFWAARNNTGLCYEWAETPPPEGFTDCVEPLMDKELRYGRVQIIESTVARIHVRWTYQSCDFHYKVWGDSATEDYYFYPDGFGTRVLDLKTVGEVGYELSEFIILTPQSAYPFSILPSNLVDFLFIDGEKREITFPFFPGEQGEKLNPRGVPVVYRIHLGKHEPLTPVYFTPNDTNLPNPYGPFSDKGQIVTPVYWGNHWPLARGRTTTQAIDNRIHLTPAHNSVMTWGFQKRPEPIRTASLETLDALGRPKRMSLWRWAWLIGMTDASDKRLLEWAHSYTHPPGLDVHGARLQIDAYVPEKRAICLIVEDTTVAITIKPQVTCVNPVFEFLGAPETLLGAALSGRSLQCGEYAWDGQTLWLNARIERPETLTLQFNH